ncbi:hypothetical protein V2A60_000099 [Cordyceps javanica]|uniref:BTB/POZ domain-containing protein n=1 Tax=Cordyceps javanica TaxID=43265 RepID=A0A545W3L6_9HYPO|nr:BTB/POZ domain-containing protein [Cordyceps javanica]TQW08520.1 BTB/POZ domain protein [Cordyceps javanica]
MSALTRGPNFANLLKTGQYSDLKLICGGREFHVHRVVVCLQSDVLAAAIRGPFQEAKTGTIAIEEFDADTVERMVQFLYTADYGPSLPDSERPDDGAVVVASSAAQEQDLLQHVHLNSIADYYNIKALADLSKTKIRDALQNTAPDEASLLDAAKEALNTTGDTSLHDMLAEAAAGNIANYLETDQLADLVGSFGVRILENVAALQGELRLQNRFLQRELNSERARLNAAEARSARIMDDFSVCLERLAERRACRNHNCQADFNCYIEERGHPSDPAFILRCAHCGCWH